MVRCRCNACLRMLHHFPPPFPSVQTPARGHALAVPAGLKLPGQREDEGDALSHLVQLHMSEWRHGATRGACAGPASLDAATPALWPHTPPACHCSQGPLCLSQLATPCPPAHRSHARARRRRAAGHRQRDADQRARRVVAPVHAHAHAHPRVPAHRVHPAAARQRAAAAGVLVGQVDGLPRAGARARGVQVRAWGAGARVE